MYNPPHYFLVGEASLLLDCLHDLLSDIKQDVKVVIHVVDDDVGVSQEKHVDGVDGVLHGIHAITAVNQLTDRWKHLSDYISKLVIFKELAAILHNQLNCVN